MEMFNSTTGKWTALPKPPVSYENAAGVTGAQGKIYGIGGGAYYGDGTVSVTNYVYSFSTKTNTWTEKAPLPTARVSAQAVTGPDGLIYALGGDTQDPCYLLPISVSTVEAYNPTTNQWQSSAPMLTPRTQFGAVVANGRIYAIGGLDNFDSSPCNNHDSLLSSVESYSFASRSWSYVAPLPTAATIDGAVVGADGRIYVLDTNGGPWGVVYAYNPATNTWATVVNVPSPPPVNRLQTVGPMTVVGPNRELLLLENDNGTPAAAFTYPT
jgi:N-acetylneuraminic acid mutarotase